MTPRERDVLAARERGLSVKEIAAGLGLSPHTVKNCLARILLKTRTKCSMEAVYTLQPESCRQCPRRREAWSRPAEAAAVKLMEYAPERLR